MKNPDDHLSNWELNFHLYKHKLPADFCDSIETFIEFSHFFKGAYLTGAEQLTPLLKKLMMKHYPLLAEATHPVQMQYLKDLNEGHLFGLFFQMRRLLREQAEKINILEKYPKLESWRDFYCKPSQPATLEDKHRNVYLHPNDDDWKKHQAEENGLLKILHEWQEKRKTEYYDLVQPLLFEYLPQLNELEGDFWVLYAVTLRDNYEEWTSCCEHLETVIEYHLPPESVKWKDEDFDKALREQMPLYSKEVDERRKRMIYG